MRRSSAGLSGPAVVRVCGLPGDKAIAESLVCKIIDEYLDEEINYQVSIVPSCERQGENKALVDFDSFPSFLSDLKADPLASWQVHVDGEDLSFDRHFIGFTQLYEPVDVIQADIIAVCGLDGHGYGSWQGRGNLRRMWLRHFLSKDLPSCRMMIYGYNSKLARRNISTTEDYAVEFMESLKSIRGKETAQRPVIFIAHSFGGIILARSIVKASQSNIQPAISSILGLLFFAVPYRGLDVADMSRIMETEQHPRLELLKALDVDSDAFKDQLREFVDVIRDTNLVSFYETEQSRRLRQDASGNWKRDGEYFISLEPSSAVLQLLGHKETQVPIQEDHSKIVKYDSKSDRGYHIALSHLRSWLEEAKVREKADAAENIRESRYMIHLLENRRFVGRESKLTELRQKCFDNNDNQQLAIFGLGGVGKTQLTLAFCYLVKAEYPEYSIFWISASSSARFKQDFRKLARTCSLPTDIAEDDLIAQVRDYLSSEQAGKWLLVVDNADDKNLLFEDDGIIDCLPQSSSGITLFTTRYRDLAIDLAGVSIVSLEEMNPEEAEDFFAKALGGRDLLQDTETVKELLEELTCLPLAISQAASYIAKCSITIPAYLALMRSSEEEMIKLLGRDSRDKTRGTDNAIAMTWLVSFKQIKNEEPAAAEILFYLAFLESKAIPLKILPRSGSEGDLIHAIGILTGYSFLSRHGDVFEMHRLVHRAIKIWMQNEGITSYWKQQTLAHLARVFPRNDWDERGLWREFTPHTIRLLRDTEDMTGPHRAILCQKLGKTLREDGQTSEAVKWIGRSVSLSEETLPEENADRLRSEQELALTYLLHGRVREGVKILERVVVVREKTLAEDHPERLLSQHEFGRACLWNGRMKDAVEVLKKVVAIKATLLAEDDPERLSSQHMLAYAYLSNGQVEEALQLLKRVVEIKARTRAEDHPERLESQHVLAYAYLWNGQVEEAIELLETTVSIKERVLAEDHPERLVSQHVLTHAYLSNEQTEEAVKILKDIVSIRARTLAENHPHLLASEHDLAHAYLSNGQIEKALEILEKVVAFGARAQAPGHPDQLASQHELARAYLSDGQVVEALEILREVIAIREIILEQDHPHRLASEHELARAYLSNNQATEAVEILENIVAIEARTLPEDHPERLASQQILAFAYDSSNEVERAIPLMQHVVAIQQKSLRADHPERAYSESELSKMLSEKHRRDSTKSSVSTDGGQVEKIRTVDRGQGGGTRAADKSQAKMKSKVGNERSRGIWSRLTRKLS